VNLSIPFNSGREVVKQIGEYELYSTLKTRSFGSGYGAMALPENMPSGFGVM
jgi:hypothetical protein